VQHARESRPYCGFWFSFLSVYTMLLGEVDEKTFQESNVATTLFVMFMFLCVILLANVLISIVTDSYTVIQDQRTAYVFCTNRLDFVVEMVVIANGPWKRRAKQVSGLGSTARNSSNGGIKKTFGKDSWGRGMELFEVDIDDSIFSMNYWLTRVFVASCAGCCLVPSRLGGCGRPQVLKCSKTVLIRSRKTTRARRT
jgi:hypothetical protein